MINTYEKFSNGSTEVMTAYQKCKLDEQRQAQEFIDKIYAVNDPDIRYKTSHPVTDLKDMINQSVERYGVDHVAFKQRFKKGEPFSEITYGQTLNDMNALGSKLIEMGLKDKRIAVIGENCYQWAVSYLAVVNGVGVIVPLDKELGKAELEGLIRSSEAEAVIFTKKYLKTFTEIYDKGITSLKFLINMNAEESDDKVLSLSALISEGKALLESGDRSYLDAEIDIDTMSVLLFTSGTTGIAKGVMISHRALCTNLMAAPMLFETTENDIFFSILPIHHTYECTCTFLMGLYKGSCIAFCEGLKYIQKNLKEIKPTFFLGVPLIFESLYKSIWKNIKKQGKEDTVKKILKANRITSKLGIHLNKLLLKDILDVFGGNLDVMIAGGAAMDPEVLQFYRDLGITAIQGYGLTECAPMAALNPDINPINTSCGHILPGTEARIVDEEDGVGEICLKGPHLMLGYYGMPEETAKVLVDGWFHTGDIGYIKNGYIYITGRKKNVIITRNGKNVFPEELEYILCKIPYIAEAMVWADSDESGQDDVIVATIRPDMDAVREALGEEAASDESKILELIQSEVDKINARLPIFKQMRKVVLHFGDFEKTTAHKIKRFVEANKVK